MKRMPADLQDTLQLLYRTLSGLEDGSIESGRATAIATVCRAIVTVFDMGTAEKRIGDLEARMKEQQT
jgi:hypothetical protein